MKLYNICVNETFVQGNRIVSKGKIDNQKDFSLQYSLEQGDGHLIVRCIVDMDVSWGRSIAMVSFSLNQESIKKILLTHLETTAERLFHSYATMHDRGENYGHLTDLLDSVGSFTALNSVIVYNIPPIFYKFI
jgi:hypothetical protein